MKQRELASLSSLLKSDEAIEAVGRVLTRRRLGSGQDLLGGESEGPRERLTRALARAEKATLEESELAADLAEGHSDLVAGGLEDRRRRVKLAFGSCLATAGAAVVLFIIAAFGRLFGIFETDAVALVLGSSVLAPGALSAVFYRLYKSAESKLHPVEADAQRLFVLEEQVRIAAAIDDTELRERVTRLIFGRSENEGQAG